MWKFMSSIVGFLSGLSLPKWLCRQCSFSVIYILICIILHKRQKMNEQAVLPVVSLDKHIINLWQKVRLPSWVTSKCFRERKSWVNIRLLKYYYMAFKGGNVHVAPSKIIWPHMTEPLQSHTPTHSTRQGVHLHIQSWFTHSSLLTNLLMRPISSHHLLAPSPLLTVPAWEM